MQMACTYNRSGEQGAAENVPPLLPLPPPPGASYGHALSPNCDGWRKMAGLPDRWVSLQDRGLPQTQPEETAIAFSRTWPGGKG